MSQKLILPDTIHPQNILDIQRHMEYRANILQNDPSTIRCRRLELNHLLLWANDTPFHLAPTIDPVFPAYLLTSRNDGQDRQLSPKSFSKITEGARMFFSWAKAEYPDRYKGVETNWIKSIRPNRSNSVKSEIRVPQAWPLEDVLSVARLKLDRLADRRDQAAICFLYLSGMRIAAFVSLPVGCIDLENLRIEQLPSKGVLTKNHKAAVTTLLPIPELLEVVKAWDSLVRSAVSKDTPWYATLARVPGNKKVATKLLDAKGTAQGRRTAVIEGIMRMCEIANIPYRSPHKLRHGHAVYGIKHSQNMAQFKAVSQNLMHSSLTVTDSIYANLKEDDLRSAIASLGDETEKYKGADPSQLANTLLSALLKRPDLLKELLTQ
jgi:integrase